MSVNEAKPPDIIGQPGKHEEVGGGCPTKVEVTLRNHGIANYPDPVVGEGTWERGDAMSKTDN